MFDSFTRHQTPLNLDEDCLIPYKGLEGINVILKSSYRGGEGATTTKTTRGN